MCQIKIVINQWKVLEPGMVDSSGYYISLVEFIRYFFLLRNDYSFSYLGMHCIITIKMSLILMIGSDPMFLCFNRDRVVETLCIIVRVETQTV